MRQAVKPVGCVALAFALQPLPTAAQSPEPVAVLSADSVEIAEVFELRVEVPVPSGSVVYFPDYVPATDDVESFTPVDWRARRGPDGGATIELTYALMPFGMGNGNGTNAPGSTAPDNTAAAGQGEPNTLASAPQAR